MRVLVAIDKFKHSLTAFQAAEAVREGLLLANPRFTITTMPLSDGGDGWLDVFINYGVYHKQYAIVKDPLNRFIQSVYLLSDDRKTAVIEMARASGLLLLQPSEYDCLHASSYGTGELIKDAFEKGARHIILGIGGSATNDGGMGMATALGYRFLDDNGNELAPMAKNLKRICIIEKQGYIIQGNIQITVASDVENVLTGTNGATYSYAKQKGASDKELELMEEGMIHFASIIKRDLNSDVINIKGGGAAGGLGAGAFAFLKADMKSGIELLLNQNGFEEKLFNADMIITGEGKIDEQTFRGKLVYGIARKASEFKKPVIAVCGSLNLSVTECNSLGLLCAFSIIDKPLSTTEALENSFELLKNTAFHIGKLISYENV